MFVTLLVSKEAGSEREVRPSQEKNIWLMSVTLLVLNVSGRVREVRAEQLENIEFMFVTCVVFKFEMLLIVARLERS